MSSEVWTVKESNFAGWVVLLYSGIGNYQCAVGPFESEEEARKYAREKGGRMPHVVKIYSSPKQD